MYAGVSRHGATAAGSNAAVNASKPYLVKVSGLATFPGSFVDSGRWHAEVEADLADSGLGYTCLHPYFSAISRRILRLSIRDGSI